MQHRHAGWTLVELIFVIAILGILAGIAIPIFQGHTDKARVASFIEQAEVWRKKAAIESSLAGADLCSWDDAKYGNLREKIFGTSSTQPLTFSDYQLQASTSNLNSAGSTAQTGQGVGNLPVVVAVVATASEGEQALRIAKLIREAIDKNGWRYVHPRTDRDLASMQAFSLQLGSCQGSTTANPQTTPQGPVAAVVSVGTPSTTKPAIPTPSVPNCGPTDQPKPDNSGCVPKTCPLGQTLDAAGTCFTPATCTVLQVPSPDQKSCLPKTCPKGEILDSNGKCASPPKCSPIEVLSADQKTCVPKTCPSGQRLDNRGQCFTPAQCSVLQVQSTDQKSCLPKTCPAGEVLTSKGTCVPQTTPSTSNSCPPGMHMNPQGRCVGHGH